MHRTALRLAMSLVCLLSAGRAGAVDNPRHTQFESGLVRPLALSPDGHWLYAVNTPDSRLEIFAVTARGLRHVSSVVTGLEPVSVAVRGHDEVWVVNHLSDSVAIVDVSSKLLPRVTRTLLVGDEPRDLVFAGPARRRAFITTAHRGQNTGRDPQLTTPGVGRADVWVFDAANLGSGLGGTPLTVVTLFADTPRALAVSPDGGTVYAAAFLSGNRTTQVNDFAIPPELVLGPATNHAGVPQPAVGMIVRFIGGHWLDELGRSWDPFINFDLPDRDVFAIDANAAPPALIPGGERSGVGTVLYNMAVNPRSGTIYVSNVEAHNERRFEGPGVFAGDTVRGRFAENRITVIAGETVAPRHLNKHIDFQACCAPIPNPENALSLALPTAMVVSADGATLYVAALGSGKVGVYDTAALEDDTFTPSLASQIPLSGGGPSGLALDEGRRRLYVLTRFDNAIKVVSTVTRAELASVSMFNPEGADVVRGRRFLYDAAATSSHGDSACASCHVFGDFDALAWDLGNPDDDPLPNLNPLTPDLAPIPFDPSFQPMKGPMATQSLRGMANHGPMHWRGDRNGALEAPNAQPNGGAFDERAAFQKFQAGFVGLLGRHAPLADADMDAFTDFILQVTYPPNPIRNLDSSLTPEQAAGRHIFMTRITDLGIIGCAGCHTLDPTANPGERFPGFFGTSGLSSRTGGRPQIVKVPHLRNLYQKVGMFGSIALPPFIGGTPPLLRGFLGDQLKGFGFNAAGDFDTPIRFFNVAPFSRDNVFGIPNPDGFIHGEAGDAERRLVEAFVFAFDSNMAPIVGQQATLSPATSGAAHQARVDLLESRAAAGECDLAAHFGGGLVALGFLYEGGGRYRPDRATDLRLSSLALRLLARLPGQAVTFTCVPPGTGCASPSIATATGCSTATSRLTPLARRGGLPGRLLRRRLLRRRLLRRRLDDVAHGVAPLHRVEVDLPFLFGHDVECSSLSQSSAPRFAWSTQYRRWSPMTFTARFWNGRSSSGTRTSTSMVASRTAMWPVSVKPLTTHPNSPWSSEVQAKRGMWAG
jgi:DNA-binding beta-propeller fold protein YncE